MSGGTRAEMVVDALPPLPAGRTYQVWISEPGQPIRSGGVFAVNSHGDGFVRITTPVPLERVSAVAVTQEPAPGSANPTGLHLLDWTPTGAPASK
jgi:anti-sigma-K factor RskA